MSKKSELKKAIAESKKEIEELERKRFRSQSALLEAVINRTQMSERDKEYFRLYSGLIEVERENLRQLKDELKDLE